MIIKQVGLQRDFAYPGLATTFLAVLPVGLQGTSFVPLGLSLLAVSGLCQRYRTMIFGPSKEDGA